MATALEDPKRAIRREHEQLVHEKEAFERFYKRVQAFETEQPTLSKPTALSHERSAGGLGAVQDAYSETVMTVPHYAEMYDETCHENMAEELGDELAAAITRSSQFTNQLKRSLLDATRQAIDDRDQVLAEIDTELTWVTEFESEIMSVREELDSLQAQPIAQLEFNVLRLTRERLQTLQTRCDELAAKRQKQIRQRQDMMVTGICTFEQYLYSECESLHPVLATIADIGECIDETQDRVERQLLAGT